MSELPACLRAIDRISKLPPLSADAQRTLAARFIDLDAPMPPLRPYAISISLRPSQEMNDGMTQESYAYFLDNMIFK